MTTQRPILATTDLSAAARQALAHGDRLSSKLGAPFHVAHVVRSKPLDLISGALPFSRQTLIDQVKEKASESVRAEIDAASVGAEPVVHIRFGKAFNEIAAQAEDLNAQLLVLGYHGASGAGQGPGSVAKKCVRHAPCNVLLVTEDAPKRFERVVVGIDFSDNSRIALDEATRIAATHESELILLHVYSNPFEFTNFAGLQQDTSEQFAMYLQSLRTEMEHLEGEIRSKASGVSVRHELLQEQSYGRAISGYCKQNQIDLAVIGALGRAGLRYLLLGSTAERVLQTTPCSVLTVRL